MDAAQVSNLQQMRSAALQRGDTNLAVEIELALEKHGITRYDTQLQDTPAMKERAVSHTPPVKRGKQR